MFSKKLTQLNSGKAVGAVVLGLLIFIIAAGAQAQVLTAIHTFAGRDGSEPLAGLTMDRAGNLYGTTSAGGTYGYGSVFKMSLRNSVWTLTPLYSFQGGDDGYGPQSRVIVGPDGALYGTTLRGGGSGCYTLGCGTVYQLRPPTTLCKSFLCSWTETVLHRFGDVGSGDGIGPEGDLAFDSAGNLFGATAGGGSIGEGSVFEMTKSGGSWTETVVFSFGSQGLYPNGGVIFDHSGNLYGTTTQGGVHGFGTVYQLAHSGSGWAETTLHPFQNSTDGSQSADLVFDGAGNLYGANYDGGVNGGGTVYEVSPSGGGWTFQVIYAFQGPGFGGPLGGGVTLDAAGNVYGATESGGVGYGNAFKLTPSGGSWSYTDLHDFHVLGSDGFGPNGSMVLDASGNIYGTTEVGGSGNPGKGVVFQIAQ